MAAERQKKGIWVLVKRLDLPEAERQSADDIKELSVSSGSLQPQICAQLNLDRQLVLKMRNHRGSLVPISHNLPPSSKNYPYTLEVTGIHQNVKPQPKTVEFPNYYEVLETASQRIVERVHNLEMSVPELKCRRTNRIEKDMSEIGQKLAFLNKRFEAAESSAWKGMFKKNPFW